MRRTYYTPDESRHCTAAALANALVELGEHHRAEVLYERFPEHPYVRQGSCHILLLPRVLHDLTKGAYSGRLVLSRGTFMNVAKRNSLRETLGTNPKERLRELIEQYDQDGSLAIQNITSPSLITRVPSPTIVAVKKRKRSHAVVVTQGYVIDNGIATTRDLENERAVAVLTNIARIN